MTAYYLETMGKLESDPFPPLPRLSRTKETDHLKLLLTGHDEGNNGFTSFMDSFDSSTCQRRATPNHMRLLSILGLVFLFHLLR